MSVTVALPILAAAAALGQAPAVPSDLRPFTLDDGFRLRTLHGRTGVDVTDDGALVAYTAETRLNWLPGGGAVYTPTGVMQEVASAEVWITSTRTGASRRVSPPNVRAWGARWSPDDSRLAYFSDEDGVARLWILDRDSSERQPVKEAAVRTFFPFESPEWSPDGRYVYFKALSPEYEQHAGTANANWPQEALPFEPWRPAGEEDRSGATGVAVVRRASGGGERHGAGEDADAPEERRHDGAGVIDLARYDTKRGVLERIASGLALRDFDISRDGRWASMFVYAGRSLTAQQVFFSLRVVRADVDPAASAPRTIDDRVLEGYGLSTSWSPDSRRLALVTTGQMAEGDVLVYDIPSGRMRNLTEDVDENFGRGDWHEVRPLWTPDGRSLLFAGDGDLWRFNVAPTSAVNLTQGTELRLRDPLCRSESSVVWTVAGGGAVLVPFADRTSGETGFARVGLDGSLEVVFRHERDMPGNPRFYADVAGGARTIVFRAETPDQPAWHWIADESFSAPRRLPGPNDWLEDFDLGRREVLEWTLDDGRTARGLLILPRRAQDGPPPCVVRVYAGSSPSGQVSDFSPGGAPEVDHPALFLGRGVAVFFPDMPIGDAEPMRSIWEVTEPALDALAESGLVDADRLGVFGHSYGGYTVNCLVAQTDRFAAAAASTGFCDLANLFLDYAAGGRGTGYFEHGQARMGATLWEDHQRYVRNSPVYFADDITTPLLLIHGREDSYHEQSRLLFAAMLRLGKECEFASYPNAEHWFGVWSEEQLRDFWDRILAWFEERLNGA